MGTIIIIAVLIIIVIASVVSSRKHFRGQGGCCGGSGDAPAEHKKLTEPKIGEMRVNIEGMHCDNCKNSIERAVNKFDGAVCHVSLKKKTAVIEYSKEISEEQIRSAIERLDFKVTGIERKEA